jgi:hypothetical protein
MTTIKSHSSPSGHRSRKDELRDILLVRNTVSLIHWAHHARNPLRTLHMLLWDHEALLRWRAIEALGMLSGELFAHDDNTLREFIRKLFWSMNDESGSLCPHAPEAIAELLHRSPVLRHEFLEHWLSFLDEEPFEIGMRSGIVRLCSGALTHTERELIAATCPTLVQSTYVADPAVRGTALCALINLGVAIPDSLKQRLSGDTEEFDMYDFAQGKLVHRTIAACIP